MEKGGFVEVDVDGLQARMAKLKKDSRISEGTQPRQAFRVLTNPKLDSINQVTNDLAGSGSNVNAMDARGDVEIDASTVSRKDPGATCEDGYTDEVFGSYFLPNTSCMPNVGVGFFPTTTTTLKDTTVDANFQMVMVLVYLRWRADSLLKSVNLLLMIRHKLKIKAWVHPLILIL